MTTTESIYKHTQIGYLLITMLGGALIALLVLLAAIGFTWVGIGVAAVLGCCLYLFSSLTIEITSTTIEFYFAARFLQQRLPLTTINEYRLVTNPWYYGWGIHLIPGGWLYNVSGFTALALTMNNGRKLHIGTDDAARLYTTLHAVIESMPGR